MRAQNLPPKAEIQSMMEMLFSDAFRQNPLLYVMWAFPWGQKGTPLERFKGPRKWQREELEKMAAHIKENVARVSRGEDPLVYKSATCSGRGPGKSAFVAWVNLWMMSCIYGSTSILTANTHDQLATKTFGEIGNWQALALNNFFFEPTQLTLKPAAWYEKILREEMKIGTKYFYANGVLWDEDRPDAFVGAHSQVGMMVSFDEASGIPPNIYTATAGFFTEKTIYRFWFAFSNPRAGAGYFYDIFNEPDESWNRRQINSLDVEDIDTSELEAIIKKHGADSDEARVEVFGQFPRQGDRQFISRAIVEESSVRQLDGYDNAEPLLMGVDPARFGDDATVVRFRQGRDARSIPPLEFRGLDNMQVVAKLTQAIFQFNPDAIFIDSGAGAGIIDRLRELGYKVHEVHFGGTATEEVYFDHRTDMWAKMAEWLRGGMIDNHRDLKNDLGNPQKEFVGREGKIKLESKEKMKSRGIKSPNHGDALALTFHAKVAKKSLHSSRPGKGKRYRPESKNILD